MPKRTQKKYTKKNKKTPNKKRPIKHKRTRSKLTNQYGGGVREYRNECNIVKPEGINSQAEEIQIQDLQQEQRENELRVRLLNLLARCALQQEFSLVDFLNDQGINSYLLRPPPPVQNQNILPPYQNSPRRP